MRKERGTLTYGSQVTGTFTIDYTASDPAESFGTFGNSASFWNAMNSGGAGFNQAALSTLVFSSTLQGGGYSFSVAPGSYEALSSLFGSPVTYGFSPVLQNSFSGSTQTADALGGYSSSFISLFASASGESVYNAQGLPVFNGSDSFLGNTLQSSADGSLYAYVDYQITSISPVSAVPEPSTYAAMLIGIALMGYWMRRRQTPICTVTLACLRSDRSIDRRMVIRRIDRLRKTGSYH